MTIYLLQKYGKYSNINHMVIAVQIQKMKSKIGDRISESFKVNKCLRQGRWISPKLLKIYIAKALKTGKRTEKKSMSKRQLKDDDYNNRRSCQLDIGKSRRTFWPEFIYKPSNVQMSVNSLNVSLIIIW